MLVLIDQLICSGILNWTRIYVINIAHDDLGILRAHSYLLDFYTEVVLNVRDVRPVAASSGILDAKLCDCSPISERGRHVTLDYW